MSNPKDWQPYVLWEFRVNNCLGLQMARIEMNYNLGHFCHVYRLVG